MPRIHLRTKAGRLNTPLSQQHSIWLCPEPKAARGLRARISSLTADSATPAFEPHVTLLGDLSASPLDSLAACREVFAQTGTVSARVTDVAQTDSFFMALFLDLRLTPDLTEERRGLEERFGIASTTFRPHLSLAYGVGSQPVDSLARLAGECVGEEILLDRVAVVASSRDLPIERWRVLHELPLI